MNDLPLAVAAPPARYHPALTGMRAVAAYLVFWHHVNPLRAHSGGPHPALLRALLKVGSQVVQQWHLGVTIFFVLSGFLIASRYANEVALTGKWFGRYLRKRFARIYPLYSILTGLTIAFQLSGIASYNAPALRELPALDQVISLLLNITLLRGLFAQFYITSGIDVAWSLSVELLFYLTVPVALVLARKQAWKLLFYPLVLLVSGVALAAAGRAVPVYLYGWLASLKFILNWTFFGRCSEFTWGIALAYWLKRYPPAATSGRGLTASGALGIVGCTGLLTWAEWAYPRSAEGLHTYQAIAVNNLLLPAGIALLFAGLLREKTWLRYLLETRLFSVLGKSSYTFYLVHNGLLRLFMLENMPGSLPLLAAATAVAVLLHYGVEEPLHAYCYAAPVRS